MSAARHLLALGLIAIFACTAGCGDDDNVAPKTDSGITGDGNQIQPDGHVPGTDQGNTFTPCQCSADQVCDSNGSCIPAPQPKPTDYVGEIMLLRQTDLTQRTVLGSTWPTIGKPEAGFRLHEAIPEDFRVQFSTAEGETCYYEFGTQYPWNLPNNAWWPQGPGKDAGTLTIKVAGGPSDIIMTNFEGGSSGWIYSLGDTPPHLSEGSTSYRQFFEQQYVPAGARFTVEAVGGTHFAAQTFSGGLIPLEFNMINPNYEEAGVTQTYGNDVPVSWTPGQPSATMKISFTQSMGLDAISLLTCHVKDDGQALIPGAAFAEFLIGEIGVYMERDTRRYIKASALDGADLHLDLVGRHARYGFFTFTM